MEELIYAQNPWWEWSNWEVRDRDLRNYSRASVRWVPSWLREISLEPFSLNIVVGPRQVGKTTGAKLLVSELVKARDPRSVFYFSCDLAADARELRWVLDFYRRFKQANGVESSVIILDEVTGLEDWWRVVKGYVDLNLLEWDVLVLLGSASFRLRRFAEAFPGRWGEGRTVEVLPLSFPEYLSVHGVEAKRGEGRVLALFERYLETGGYPRSVNGDEEFAEDLVASVEKDAVKAGRDPKLLRMVARELISRAPSATSFNAIAGDLGVSHNTVHDYVRLMEDMFLVGVAYMREGGRVLYRREKKIFFRDPFAARAFATLLGAELSEAALLEWVVQEHAYRRLGEVYFWRNSYEIDVIAGRCRIEVKAGRARRGYPKGVLVLSKEEAPFFLLDLQAGACDAKEHGGKGSSASPQEGARGSTS
jgi:predicted AAA+ superfamily ATPase